VRDHDYNWCCVWITQTQIAKFEALIVRDVLGSVFVFGYLFGRVFDFGDVFGSASDVNKPMVCLHILYGDVFERVFYFGDVFGSAFNFGDMLRSAFVIGDVYVLHTNRLPSLKHQLLAVS
jgi:hypothetical protein